MVLLTLHDWVTYLVAMVAFYDCCLVGLDASPFWFGQGDLLVADRSVALYRRIVQVGALGQFGPGVRYAFEVYQVSATSESVTASGS